MLQMPGSRTRRAKLSKETKSSDTAKEERTTGPGACKATQRRGKEPTGQGRGQEKEAEA